MNIRIKTPDVIHESFDNESVIVNLRVGVYFSLDEAGLALWEEIGKGVTEKQLCDLWQARYGVDESIARRVIRDFLKELHEEQLIVTDAEYVLSGKEEVPEGTKRPGIQKYTDLQDLLMLDPIHDVDDRGWPHSKPADDVAAST